MHSTKHWKWIWSWSLWCCVHRSSALFQRAQFFLRQPQTEQWSRKWEPSCMQKMKKQNMGKKSTKKYKKTRRQHNFYIHCSLKMTITICVCSFHTVKNPRWAAGRKTRVICLRHFLVKLCPHLVVHQWELRTLRLASWNEARAFSSASACYPAPPKIWNIKTAEAQDSSNKNPRKKSQPYKVLKSHQTSLSDDMTNCAKFDFWFVMTFVIFIICLTTFAKPIQIKRRSGQCTQWSPGATSSA